MAHILAPDAPRALTFGGQSLLFTPPPPSPIELWPFQATGVDTIRDRIRAGRRRILVVSPTGSGKTVTFAHVIVESLRKGKRALVLAHRVELINQTIDKLVRAGVPEVSIGVIRSHDLRHSPNAPVQVASVQTLAKRRYPPADLVVTDEAHRAVALGYQTIIEHYPQAAHLWFTATPWRTDGRGLGEFCDDLVVMATVPELIAEGFLVPARTFTHPEPADLAKVKRSKSGDFNEEELVKVMDQRHLVGDLVAHWKKHAEGLRTFAFGVNVTHARHIAEAFAAAGIPAEHIDGTTDEDVRARALARLASGEILVLANCGVCTEGTDCPPVKCVIMARPTLSKTLWHQCVGRGLRIVPGHPELNMAVVLDHGGNARRLGLITDEQDYSLDGRAKRKNAPSVRTCEQCYAALPGGTQKCPECGYVFPVEPEREHPEHIEGELVEAKTPPAPTMEERLGWYAEVLTNAVSRGWKLGAARHRYKERFGMWPRGPRAVALEREHYPQPTIEEVVDRVELPPDVAPLEPAPLAPVPTPELPALAALGIEPAPIEAPVRKVRRINLAALLPPEPATTAQETESWTL